MRRLIRIALLLVAVVIALFGAVIIASESGEVVVLRTYDSSQVSYETRLWIIEEGYDLWLRAGEPDSGWFQRLKLQPDVELTRAGETHRYRATPVEDPDVRDWLNGRLAEKYGWADSLVGVLGDRSVSVPIRLGSQ
jgi:hypothetical protein